MTQKFGGVQLSVSFFSWKRVQ